MGNRYLHIPVAIDAPFKAIMVHAGDWSYEAECRLAQQKIDGFMYVVIPEAEEVRLEALEGSGEGLIGAAYMSDVLHPGTYEEPLRPVVQFMPERGAIGDAALTRSKGKWQLNYRNDGLTVEGINGGQRCLLESMDLLHWKRVEAGEKETDDAVVNKIEGAMAKKWHGDIGGLVASGEHTFAVGTPTKITDLMASTPLSLPTVYRDGALAPAPQVENLRVWKREWRSVGLGEDFRFDGRFRMGPGPWPEIALMPPDGTDKDVIADAMEFALELYVGQAKEICFCVCGVDWRWDSLKHILSANGHTVPLIPQNERIKLHFYCDRSVQTCYTHGGDAVMLVLSDGAGKERYQIQSELVENINNDSFAVYFYPKPNIRIEAEGSTAEIICLNAYGLRGVRWSGEARAVIDGMEKGRELYACESYKVYENCIEDNIYGPPAAWVKEDKIYSPVRVVEEFAWRATPWGDMTRVIDRGDTYRCLNPAPYPTLKSKVPVLDATFGLAMDTLYLNSEPAYSLPGQEGLISGGLFQGKGESFGIWMRDASHAAFRLQNLVAPERIRKSLLYITSGGGFRNGGESEAMPAIAIWDYYLATGEKALLFEAAPCLIGHAKHADTLFDESAGLIHGEMSPGQDAFPEPEVGGYAMGVQVFFAHTYLCTANILEVIQLEETHARFWRQRGEELLATIKEKYWQEEQGLYTSGPVGSIAFEHGYWEATGAELSIWPQFGIATDGQRGRCLDGIREHVTDFGMDWYPFQEGKNHFWGCCWPSWTLGIAVGAAVHKKYELMEQLIFGQIRNGLLHKTFYEVMDKETGRAWRWPGMVWHAAAFGGYVIKAMFGITYSLKGLSFAPSVPEVFADMKLCGLKYRDAELDIAIEGYGADWEMYLDDVPQPNCSLDANITGKHTIRLVSKE